MADTAEAAAVPDGEAKLKMLLPRSINTAHYSGIFFKEGHYESFQDLCLPQNRHNGGTIRTAGQNRGEDSYPILFKDGHPARAADMRSCVCIAVGAHILILCLPQSRP